MVVAREREREWLALRQRWTEGAGKAEEDAAALWLRRRGKMFSQIIQKWGLYFLFFFLHFRMAFWVRADLRKIERAEN